MYVISYTIKDVDGFLVDRKSKFDTFQLATNFMRDLRARTGQNKLVGVPMIERV